MFISPSCSFCKVLHTKYSHLPSHVSYKSMTSRINVSKILVSLLCILKFWIAYTGQLVIFSPTGYFCKDKNMSIIKQFIAFIFCDLHNKNYLLKYILSGELWSNYSSFNEFMFWSLVSVCFQMSMSKAVNSKLFLKQTTPCISALWANGRDYKFACKRNCFAYSHQGEEALGLCPAAWN